MKNTLKKYEIEEYDSINDKTTIKFSKFISPFNKGNKGWI